MKSFVIFHVIFLSIIVNCIAHYSPEDCRLLGFIKPNLICSTCEKFKQYNISEVCDSCYECCLKIEDDEKKLYSRAVLEVCTCKFGAYPQIEAFIKSHRPNKYNNLQIRYVRGLDPVISLYDDNDEKVDDVDIHKWDTDSIDEFLSEFL